jgi:RNA polymerase sigma-B factor
MSQEDERTQRDELVEEYYGLAVGLAKRYAYTGESLQDLIQVACLGLVKAASRFDPERGTRFPTFAVPTILGELKRHFRDTRWSLKLPRHLQEHALLVRDAVERLSQELGRSPTVEDIAQGTALSEDEVIDAMDVMDTHSSVPLEAEGDGSEQPRAYQIGEADDGLEQVEMGALLESYMSRVPEREREILQLRFVHEWTQSQIAEHLGLSQMHISRLLRKTLIELRSFIEEDEAAVEPDGETV